MAIMGVLQVLGQVDTTAYDRGMQKMQAGAKQTADVVKDRGQAMTSAFSGLLSFSGVGDVISPLLGKITSFAAVATQATGGVQAGLMQMTGTASGVAKQAFDALGGSAVLNGARAVAGFFGVDLAIKAMTSQMAIAQVVGAEMWASIIGGAAIAVSVVAGVLLALGAAATLGGLGLLYMSSKGSEAIATLRHLARELGTTTEAMSALERFGGGGDTFAHAMLHMQASLENLSPAAERALSRLGINANHLRSLDDASQQIRLIAAGWGNLTTNIERAQAVRALFGRGGFALLDDLARGAAGIDNMTTRAERFGLVMTGAQSDIVAQANREWANLGMVWDGLSRQAAIAFAPLWEIIGREAGNAGESILRLFREWAPTIQIAANVAGEFVAMILRAVGSFASMLTQGVTGINSVNSTFLELSATAIVSFNRMGDMWRVIVDTMKVKFYEFVLGVAEKINQLIGRLNILLAGLRSVQALLPENMRVTVPNFSNVATEGLRAEIDRLTASIREGRASINLDIQSTMGRLLNQVARAWQAAANVVSTATPPIETGQLRADLSHGAALAGSERAFTLLYGTRGQQDYNRQIAEAAREQVVLQRDLLREQRNAPAIRRARM